MKKRNKKLPVESKDLKKGTNKFNSLASSILGDLAKIRNKSLKETFRTFKTRPHRLELIAEFNGIKFVNDSKATNIDALWYALEETEAPIILLAGGMDKNDDLAPVVDLIKEKVELLILIGKDNTRFRSEFQKYARIEEIPNMEQAVLVAYKNSAPGTTILLSPGAASWDLYENYEERGDKFREAVKKIIEKVKK